MSDEILLGIAYISCVWIASIISLFILKSLNYKGVIFYSDVQWSCAIGVFWPLAIIALIAAIPVLLVCYYFKWRTYVSKKSPQRTQGHNR